jgi:hypothetical protein
MNFYPLPQLGSEVEVGGVFISLLHLLFDFICDFTLSRQPYFWFLKVVILTDREYLLIYVCI